MGACVSFGSVVTTTGEINVADIYTQPKGFRSEAVYPD